MASRFAVLSEGPHNLVTSYDKKNNGDLFQPKSLSSDKQRDVFICIKSKTTSRKFVRTRWTTYHIYAFENHKFALYKE